MAESAMADATTTYVRMSNLWPLISRGSDRYYVTRNSSLAHQLMQTPRPAC